MPSHFQHPAHLSLGRMRIRAESRFCQSMFVELLILYPSLCKQSSSTVKGNVQAPPRLFGVALPHRSRFAATLRGSSCFSFFDKVWCFLQCFNCQESIVNLRCILVVGAETNATRHSQKLPLYSKCLTMTTKNLGQWQHNMGIPHSNFTLVYRNSSRLWHKNSSKPIEHGQVSALGQSITHALHFSIPTLVKSLLAVIPLVHPKAPLNADYIDAVPVIRVYANHAR